MRTYDVRGLAGFSFLAPGAPTKLTARELATKYATGGTPESWALAQTWASLAVADEIEAKGVERVRT
jgi:hypothetical protein